MRYLVYRATIKSDREEKQYVGSAGNKFKERYNGHKSSFNNKKYRKSTVLANYIWDLKDNKIKYEIKWEIITRTRKKFNTKYGCALCNLEKIEILKMDETKALNKRSELHTKCPHYRKLFL